MTTAGRGAAPSRPARPCADRDTTTLPSTPAVLRPALSSVTRRTATSALARERSINFCRLRTFFRSPARDRREDPLPQPPYVLLDVRANPRRPSRRLVLGSVHHGRSSATTVSVRLQHHRGVQLAPSVPVSGSSSPPQAHPTRVSTLSGRGIRPYPASYAENHRRRSQRRSFPVSCCLSAAGIRFSGRPAPAAEFRLPHGRPTRRQLRSPGPRRGCHVPHETDTTGLGVLCTPGTVVRSRPARFPRAAPAASQRPAPISRCNIPSAEVLMTRRQRGFTSIHPSGLPQPVTPGWNGSPWASSSGFAPRSYPRRTPRRGRSLRTGPGTTSSTSVEPPSMSAAAKATSCRTAWLSQDPCLGVWWISNLAARA